MATAALRQVDIEDKYTAEAGRVYVTGSQALVRLALMQRARDRAAGLNTAGFISGYRGSPLGLYDLALWKAEPHLKAAGIQFQPGVNEDLAATAVWGSQQVGLATGEAKVEGVFALWYGKGPGVDRSGDPLKHGSYAGAAAKGGVLVLCGDDHGARSSTTAHQSDHALVHFGMPILNPASIQEYLDLGLYGFALSRFSGCWVGFKCITDTVDGSASVLVDPERVQVRLPEDFAMPPGGLNIRAVLPPLMAEKLHYEHRLAAAQAFVRANGLDGVRFGRKGPCTLGIVTAGKPFLDVIEGLRRLGIDEARAAELGIAVYKVAMTWPVEPQGLSAFAAGCRELLVIEEKRAVLEDQIARLVVNLPDGQRPRVVGKLDEAGRPLQSQVGELDPDRVMVLVAERYLALADEPALAKRLALATAPAAPAAGGGTLVRLPSFCAGCPHNTSTRVPDGSMALGGIGCHGLAVWLPERRTMGLCQMGGEGAPWIGQAPFVETPHIFQNLGDGTYFHSGLLAIRACVAAKVNITYKILLNGAIAMTGGQPIEGEQFDGALTAPHVAAQLAAEGVGRIALVTDDPTRHRRQDFPADVGIHHRDELDAVQKQLREIPGVTALIYDQSCATERRRLRKRGRVADPPERLFINSDVCEGCGDCGQQSNCVALEPEETPLGRKRRINQSVCNKDQSCLKGMCPSFVSVIGGSLRKREGAEAGAEAALAAGLPEPALPVAADTFSVMIAGIGGNGVVTMGALLGMAAHLEEKSCTVLDISGLAQRNGPVTSHVRFAAPGAGAGHAPRIPGQSADVVIGCDPVVTTAADTLARMAPERTAVVFNRFVAPTNAFATNPDLDFGAAAMEGQLAGRIQASLLFGLDATGIATRLLGDAIGANLLLVGYAWQQGLIPLSRQSIETAIRLNGSAVALNLRAFTLGRIAAAHPDRLAAPAAEAAPALAEMTLDQLVADRVARLTAYQNAAYAARYRALVDRVQAAEARLGGEALTRTVARVYARLLAYKDEYEVARLYADPAFRRRLAETFDGDVRLEFHLAPPLLSRRDPVTGRYAKRRFGPWMLGVFGMLARLKGLRGTPLDMFGYSPHRRMERRLIAEYEALVDSLLAGLSPATLAQAVELAGLADKVRGFDVVKEQAVADMARRRAALEAEPLKAAAE